MPAILILKSGVCTSSCLLGLLQPGLPPQAHNPEQGGRVLQGWRGEGAPEQGLLPPQEPCLLPAHKHTTSPHSLLVSVMLPLATLHHI